MGKAKGGCTSAGAASLHQPGATRVTHLSLSLPAGMRGRRKRGGIGHKNRD